MNSPAQVTTPKVKVRDPRNGLRTSATLATVFTILGHTVLEFEQSVAQVLVCLLTGYTCALLFEWVDARANKRAPGFTGGGVLKVADFLASAHMTSITTSFLLYGNDHLWVFSFAVALAIGSKYLFRVKVGDRLRHFMNPSNFAIAATLLIFQWSAMIPWGYTLGIEGIADWILPAIVIGLGLRLNLLFTKRLPLILSWLVAFLVQGLVRALFHGHPIEGQLLPLLNIPLVLFTLYMITDPMTSPNAPRNQVVFGVGIGLAYGVLIEMHVMFTMIYAVTAVTIIRGLYLYASSLKGEGKASPAPAFAPAPVSPLPGGPAT